MPMPLRDREMTVEDLYVMPDDGFNYELQAGPLVSEPLAGGRHGWVVAALAGILRAHVRKHRLGVVFAGDSGFVLARKPDTVRGPDVAFVSSERFERIDCRVRSQAADKPTHRTTEQKLIWEGEDVRPPRGFARTATLLLCR